MITIAARIHKSLAQDIIGGQLKPGHKLDEQLLAERFGVSRTPIREALRELNARGLVEIIPRRGGVVARIGIDRLADMLDAECELEGLCARLAAQRMTALEKGQLQDLHEQGRALIGSNDEMEYLALNQSFHDLICQGAHNRTLAAATRELRDRLAPFRQSQNDDQGRRLARSHDEHTQITEAILRGDSSTAYEVMRSHNARLSTGVINLLRSRIDEPAESTGNGQAPAVAAGPRARRNLPAAAKRRPRAGKRAAG